MEPRRAGTGDTVKSWRIDPGYTTIQFQSKVLFLFGVKGSFSDFAGTILYDPQHLSSSAVVVSINASSVTTGNARRDAKLTSPDFLDAHNHPEIRFQSTNVARGRDRDTLRITGTLSIKGRTADLVLDVLETDRSRSPQGLEVAYYSATTEVDRVMLGIAGRNGLISRRVKVAIHAQASTQG